MILVVTLRFDQDRCFEALRDAGLLAPGKPISIAPRDLVAMVFPHMHTETACFEFDSPWFCDRATSSLWRIPGDAGVVVYNLNYFPVLINFADVHAHDMAAHVTIDGHYVDRNFDFNTDLHVIDDSDRFLYISFTKQSQYYYPVRTSWLKSAPFLSRYYKISLLRKTLNGSMGNTAKRHTYPIPVVFHSKPLTAACRNLISRTLPIAQQATAPLGGRDRLFQALEQLGLETVRRAFVGGRGRNIAAVLTAWPRRRIARLFDRSRGAGNAVRTVSPGMGLFLAGLEVYARRRGNLVEIVHVADGDAEIFAVLWTMSTSALALSPHDLNLVVQHAEVAEALEMWAAAMADYEVVHACTGRPGGYARQACGNVCRLGRSSGQRRATRSGA